MKKNPISSVIAKLRPPCKGGCQKSLISDWGILNRALALFATIPLLLPLLSGCHGNVQHNAFSVPEALDTSKPIEISFWAKNDTNATQVHIYEQAIADFESYYPSIKVNLRLYTDYGKIYNDVITNLQTDTAPNVCITYPDHIATYLTGTNAVVPLDELMADEKYGLGGSEIPFDGVKSGEIVPKFLSECYLNGSYYALPYMRSTEACYVNRDFVEKLGFTLPETLTWDFIWQVSEKAMEKNADGTYKLNGQKVLIPFIYKSTDNMMISYLKQTGAGYSNALGQIQLFNETTEGFLTHIAAQAKIGAFDTFKRIGYPSNYLNAGQCIFSIDSTAGATWVGTHAPLIDIPPESLQEFETAVMTIPQVDPQNPQMISQGPSMCVFNKEDPQVVLASWLFAQYMLTNDVQIAYAQTEGYVPVTTKAQESDTYQDYLSRSGEDNALYYDVKLDATKLLLDNTANTFTTAVFNGSASLRDAAGYLIEDAVKSTRRGKKVNETYLENLFAETQSLYRLDTLQTDAGKASLNPLPPASIVLLCALAATWLGILLYLLLQKVSRK